MISTTPDYTFYFRIPTDKPGKEGGTITIEKEAEDRSPEEEEYILCRQCHQAITKPADRIVMQGSHGMVFEIGCFRSAKGCGYAGDASDDFSWFAGYSWRVCLCTMCLTHLGWMFSLKGGDIFHGLILDRLIEPD